MDKTKILAYIDKLIETKINFEICGIDAFNSLLSSSDNFEQVIILLAIQGYSSETIASVASNLLHKDNDENIRLRHYILIDFILSLQKGISSINEIKILLLSHLGTNELLEYMEPDKNKHC